MAAGCSRRAHRERADYYLEVYRGVDHGFFGHDGGGFALICRHDESSFPAARPASHEHVCEVVELLTMHLAPKQILINASANFRNELATGDIERVIGEVEALIKKAEPKVDLIFLETVREKNALETAPIPQHIG